MKIRLGNHGIHLFNRQTGTNVLIDEISVPEKLWSEAPRHVSIALTNACDLTCNYCYASKKRAELNCEIVKLWLSEIDNHGTLGVGFGGGEPTLYKYFIQLCDYTKTNTNLAISFTTHGHHLSKELVSKLKNIVHFIRISVDGLGNTYESLRKRSFSSLKEKIDNISGVIAFGINYVVNHDTLPELDNAIKFSEEAGAAEFLLLPQYNLHAKDSFSPYVLEKLQDYTDQYSGTMPLRISELCSSGMAICDPFKNDDSLQSYAHVDAFGLLKSTSYDIDGVKIGTAGFMASLRMLRQQNEKIKII